MSAVHIGPTVTKKSQKQLAKQLVKLMKAGNNHSQTGETVRHAMDVLLRVSEVKNVSYIGDVTINKSRR